jgi:phage terminase small subunit
VESTTLAQTLTEAERDVRDRFVDEYVTDYNAFAAAVRLGYAPTYAKTFSVQFMQEPYVLNRIKEQEGQQGEETEKDVHRKRLIQMLYREANSSLNSGSARVSAMTQLSKIVGVEAPVKTQTDVNLKTTEVDLSHIPVAELERMKQLVYGSRTPVH